jgi:predicted anti-sigma-YlaC factor YlaD
VSAVPSSSSCQRVREQVSLLLDDELSQLERRMLEAHLHRCADCSAYADDVTTFTDQIRFAPMETLSRQIVVQRRRRLPAIRLQAGVAAALAFAALGLGSQLAAGPSSQLSASATITRYPTTAELQREIAILRYLPLRGSRAVLPR